MQLKGSCHCGKVQFAVQSRQPYPFNLCYCSICRKTAGGGGYAINLGADHDSLQVEGADHISVYRVETPDGDSGKITQSEARRSFCKHCGSALWVWDPRWPELVHPFASAIDTDLPISPQRTHLMLAFKASWVPAHVEPGDSSFDEYPDESLAEWHRRLGVDDENA
ncbi:MAG: GFA family protein [Gammaproteobacteria bacterium]|nr:MAG: GFA family protein [Gammaproteobacteria bacterium]